MSQAHLAAGGLQEKTWVRCLTGALLGQNESQALTPGSIPSKKLDVTGLFCSTIYATKICSKQQTNQLEISEV